MYVPRSSRDCRRKLRHALFLTMLLVLGTCGWDFHLRLTSPGTNHRPMQQPWTTHRRPAIAPHRRACTNIQPTRAPMAIG